MSLTYPWLRDYNYLKDYFDTVFKYYNESYQAYPVNYYSLNIDNTIWEDTKILGGSYEKVGVGELSGVVWDKILMLPVTHIEQITPTNSNGEKGQTLENTLNSAMSVPDYSGFRPKEGDIVDLNYGISSESIKIKPLFVITNVSPSHIGRYFQFWRCMLIVAPFGIESLEKQISGYYFFMNNTHKIVPLDNANLMLKLETRASAVSNNLYNLFDNGTGFYLKE